MTFSRVTGALTALMVLGGAAHAFPVFTEKEGKSCAYCHVNAQGSGPRNYRGVFYKENNLSFAKFDDAAEAKKAGVAIGPEPTPPAKTWTPPDKPADPAQDEPKKDEPKKDEPAKQDGETKVAKGPSKEPAKPKQTTPAMTIAQATRNMRAAEAAYKKAPKDVARRNSYAEALAQLGRSTMLDQSIPPMRRYPAALSLYRRALALNPKNQVALEDRKLIEDIYKQMGRPVPK